MKPNQTDETDYPSICDLTIVTAVDLAEHAVTTCRGPGPGQCRGPGRDRDPDRGLDHDPGHLAPCRCLPATTGASLAPRSLGPRLSTYPSNVFGRS